jgi:hypothetical protein
MAFARPALAALVHPCTSGFSLVLIHQYQPITAEVSISGPSAVIGGEGGIRTLGTLLAYTRFPGELLRPLGHLSVLAELLTKSKPWAAG